MNLNSLLAFLFSLECEILRYYTRIFSLHSRKKEVECTRIYNFVKTEHKIMILLQEWFLQFSNCLLVCVVCVYVCVCVCVYVYIHT
jgi:hypothetical protein